jgi:FkbM family methyltransferase
MSAVKKGIRKVLGRLGYEIHKTRPETVPIDILPLLIQHRMETRDEASAFFFVDVGANDGVRGDPVFEFVSQFHWKGIFVEPQPRLFRKLVGNYKDEPQLIFENVALGDRDGEATFYAFKESPDLPDEASALASFDRDRLVNNGPGFKGEIEEIKVPTMTARSLLAKHDVSHIDYLQVDTEGFDYEVVRMFLETGIKPALIHYEHGCLDAETLCKALALLARHQYRVLTIGVDTIGYLQTDDEGRFLKRVRGLVATF